MNKLLLTISILSLAGGLYYNHMQSDQEAYIPPMEQLKEVVVTPMPVSVTPPKPASSIVARETPGASAEAPMTTLGTLGPAYPSSWTPPPADRVYPKDWTTNDGKTTYKGVKVVEVTPDMVTIYHADGGGLVAIDTLTPDIQRLLNYDPSLSAQAAAIRHQEDVKNAEAYIAEQNALGAKQSQSVALNQATQNQKIEARKTAIQEKITQLLNRATELDQEQKNEEAALQKHQTLLIDTRLQDGYRAQAAQLQAQLDSL